MSDTIVFPSVTLESILRNHKGGHAGFSSTFPKSVGDAMGWNGLQDGITSAKLDGELAATHVSMTPKDGALSKKYKVAFDATKVSDFQVFRLELDGHKGKGHRLELRFKVSFADTQACARLEEYMTHAGEAKAALTVSYVQQTAVDLSGPTLDEERRQATLADND